MGSRTATTRRAAAVALLCALACAPAARAQSPVPSPSTAPDLPAEETGFEGRTSVVLGSGARAFGMGGAFLARSDDATAASWNPAGLSYLRRPEISVVGARNAQKRVGASGSVVDDFVGYTPDFAAAAYPIARGSVNGAVQVSFQRVFSFQGERTVSQPSAVRHSRGTGGFDVIALGTGLQVTRNLRVGATFNRWFDGYHQRRDRGAPRAVFQDVDFRLAAWNANVGVIFTPFPALNLGVVYKTPFTGEVTESRKRTDVTDKIADTLTRNAFSSSGVRLDIPGAVGLGASWRPWSQLTTSMDYTRTFWSKGEIRNLFLLNATTPGQEAPAPSETSVPQSLFAALKYPTLTDPVQDDTGQLRVGAEYVLIKGPLRFPLRAGYFRDKQYFRAADGRAPVFDAFTVGTGVIAGPFGFDVAYLRETGRYVDAASASRTSTRFERFFASMIFRYGSTR